MNDDRHEEEAIRHQIDEDMKRFARLSQDDLDRRLDQAGIANDDDLHRILQEPPLQYTPGQVERIQRDLIQEVFRSLDPEAQAVLRLTAAALPLSNTQESLRKELADTRERAARISETIKEQTGKVPRIKRPRTAGKMLTVAQLAEALTLSSDVVYKMCETGEIPGVKRMPTGAKKNNTWRADPVVFEKWRTSPDRRVRK
jgi:hypothetical protein